MPWLYGVCSRQMLDTEMPTQDRDNVAICSKELLAPGFGSVGGGVIGQAVSLEESIRSGSPWFRGFECLSSGHSPRFHCLQKLGDLGELFNGFRCEFACLQTVPVSRRGWNEVRGVPGVSSELGPSRPHLPEFLSQCT